MRLDEIEFWDRIARRVWGTHSASGEYSANTAASYAYDDYVLSNNTTKYYNWLSNTFASGDVWFKLDAGAGNDFDCAAIALTAGWIDAGGADGGNPANFKVQYSDDDSNWTDAWELNESGWQTANSVARIFENPYYGGDRSPALGESGVLHWLKLDNGNAYKDDVSPATHCADGDPVYWIANAGSDGNRFVQTTEAYRPIYRTNGLNGRPYITFEDGTSPTGTQTRYFADINNPQPTGVTGFYDWCVAIAMDDVDTLANNAVFGNASGVSEKNTMYFRPVAGAMVHTAKTQFRIGDYTSNPTVVVANVRSFSDVWTWVNNNYYWTNNVSNMDATAHTQSQLFRHTSVPAYFSGKVYELVLLHRSSTTNWGEPTMHRLRTYMDYKFGLFSGGSPLFW